MKISTLIEKLEEIHCNAPNGGVPVELLVMTGKEWLALRAALDDTLLAIMDRADSGPNLVTIWQALEAGEGVAGCALKERGEHVRIA